jgi:two-component system sensor kinase FixL
MARNDNRQNVPSSLGSLGDLEQIINNSRAIVMCWRVEPDAFPVEFVSESIRRLGWEPDDLLSGRVQWTDITYHGDHDRLWAEVEAFVAQGIDEFDQEYRLYRPDGSLCWIEDHNHVIRNDAGAVTHIHGILFDITDRVQAQTALRESEQNFHALADNAREAILVEAEDGIELYANRFAVRLTGYSRKELLTLRMTDLVVSRDAGFVADLSRRHLAGEEVERTYETFIRRKDGREVPVEITGGQTVWRGRPATIGLLRDITDRRRLEREVVEIARQEQQRIGHDFHDTLGQQLTAISFLAKALHLSLQKASSDAADEVGHIAELAQHAVRDARRISRGLAPVDLADGGLRAALEDMTQTLSKVWKENCVLVACKDVPVHDSAVGAQLYWIAQEALSNAVRHADADEIIVHLTTQDERGFLRIRDDGIGMDMEAAVDRTGLGLRIMRYRANIIGAHLRINSQPGNGTEVVCHFANPLRPQPPVQP